MTAWLGTLDKVRYSKFLSVIFIALQVPPPPSEAFAALAKQVAFCRNALGFKDEAP